MDPELRDMLPHVVQMQRLVEDNNDLQSYSDPVRVRALVQISTKLQLVEADTVETDQPGGSVQLDDLDVDGNSYVPLLSDRVTLPTPFQPSNPHLKGVHPEYDPETNLLSHYMLTF